MKDNVDELARLFDEGKHTLEQLEGFYDTLVPFRNPVEMPQMGYSTDNAFGVQVPTMYTPKPAPEHSQTKELLETAKAHVDKWIVNVNVLLERSGKIRYKIQFNDPEWKAGANSRNLLGKHTKNEEALDELLTDFELRLDELRKIILDYERSLENTVYSSNEPVEPASYDPKTRTIFFADEAIRFNKNAEYSPAICKLMFADPAKLWQLKDFMTEWDSLYDYLPDLQKPTDWNKVYDILRKMNQRVAEATGVLLWTIIPKTSNVMTLE